MSLKAHFYAGDADKLFKVLVSGGPHTGTPTNGEGINVWQDEDTPATKDMAMAVVVNAPVWRSPGAMLLPSVDFADSAVNVKNYAATSNKALSDVITNSACTVIMAIRAEATGTNNANTYDNTGLFSDSGGYIGIHQKQNTLIAYNWDGNEDATTAISISLDTDYVIMMRHAGGTLYFSVLSGAGGATRSDQSVASGNTDDMTGVPYIGQSWNGSPRFAGCIGEVAIYDTDEGSTNSMLTDMVGRWLPAGGGGGGMVGTAALTLTTAAALSGAGALASSANITLATSSTILATGSLSSQAAMSLLAAGNLSGSGKLSGESLVSILASGFAGSLANIAGSAAIALTAAGGLQATGGLAGSVAVVVSTAADLTAFGSMAAAVAVALEATGSIRNSNVIDGPYLVTAAEVFVAGQQAAAVFAARIVKGQVQSAGARAGQAKGFVQ